LLGRFKFLRDRDALDVADGAESFGALSVVASDDDGDEFAVPILGDRARDSVITSGQPLGFEIGARRNCRSCSEVRLGQCEQPSKTH
jgi:hypothetical protein